MDIALSFDEEGHLAEAAVANVALVDAEGRLVVPEFTRSLPGTTILRAVELAETRMPVRIRPVREEEIYTAREFLLFGTTPACAAIVRYEGQPVGDGRPGPTAELLRRDLWEHLLREGTPL
jgi:branched-chain amino acid aminotransferase